MSHIVRIEFTVDPTTKRQSEENSDPWKILNFNPPDDISETKIQSWSSPGDVIVGNKSVI
jgi:hypothetical protein